VVHLITHPFVHDALATLRDVSTPPDIFRRVARRMSLLVASEALKEIPTIDGTVQTPLGPAFARRVGARVTLVPVLRAGLGMIEGVLELLPTARVGHIGLQRDEATAAATRYYVKLPPDLAEDVVLVTDPMLATGGSAVASIELLREAGARDIRFVCIVAAPEGIAAIERRFPNVPIYTPVVDRELNAHKFIVPGLGDFGDRLYGTV
jgi:uracil phosphoribosyltransferase